MAFHKLLCIVFSLLFSLKYFLIFLQTYSLISGLFSSVLFDFQVVLSFPFIFMLLISSAIRYIQNILRFRFLSFHKNVFCAQNMCYIGKYSVCFRMECLFCYFWVKCSANIILISLVDNVVWFLLFCVCVKAKGLYSSWVPGERIPKDILQEE